MLWDTHMHCCFSGDSDALPESMVQTACQKHLNGICFTDHLDYEYQEDPELFLLDVNGYFRAISNLMEQYRGRFPILWGIELGLQPQVTAQNNRITQNYPFDFVIGSSHVVHGRDPYYPDYYKNRTETEAYREYFESVLENVRTDADYDVYGHLDYVVRYGPNRSRCYSYEKFSDILDEILRELISRGKGLELNTGGYKYGLDQPNPCAAVLRRYRELGGEIITLGSDAHAPEDIAHSFSFLPKLLRQAGFDYYTVFQNRSPVFLPLDG